MLAESQGKLAIDRRGGFVFTRSAATGTILVFEARRMKARNKLFFCIFLLIFFFRSNEFEVKAELSISLQFFSILPFSRLL